MFSLFDKISWRHLVGKVVNVVDFRTEAVYDYDRPKSRCPSVSPVGFV